MANVYPSSNSRSTYINPVYPYVWRLTTTLGVSDKQPAGVRKKIILSNKLSLLMLLLVSLSTIIFYTAFADITLTAYVGSLVLIPMATLTFNAKGLQHVGRMLFSVGTPVWVLFMIVALKATSADTSFVVQANHFYTPRYYLLVLCLLPSFLIDIDERKPFLITLGINFLCLAGFDIMHSLFSVAPADFGFVLPHYHQVITMPLVLFLFLFGSITFYQFESKKYEREIKDLLSIVKQHNMQITHEMDMAKKVVERHIPAKLPKIAGVDLAAHLHWSKEVGGDYYTVRDLGEGKHLLMVADVSGNGLQASMVVSTIHSCIETQLSEGDLDLEYFMRKLNEVLCNITLSHHFATVWVGIYDENERTITSVNAGHPRPLLFRSGAAKPVEFTAGCPLLGAIDELPFLEQETFRLQQDDLLLISTDGVEETRNVQEDFYGDSERLPNVVKRDQGRPADRIIDTLLKDIRAFSGSMDFHDDLTLMVMKVK